MGLDWEQCNIVLRIPCPHTEGLELLEFDHEPLPSAPSPVLLQEINIVNIIFLQLYSIFVPNIHYMKGYF